MGQWSREWNAMGRKKGNGTWGSPTPDYKGKGKGGWYSDQGGWSKGYGKQSNGKGKGKRDMTVLDGASYMTMNDEDADWNPSWSEDDYWSAGQQLSSMKPDEGSPWEMVKPRSMNSRDWAQQGGGGFSIQYKGT